MHSLFSYSGAIMIFAGLMLTLASFMAVGKAQRWHEADNMAIESRKWVRKAGMIMSVVGLAFLVTVTPSLAAKIYGMPGYQLILIGWLVFSVCVCFFMMVLGILNITMPAFGEYMIEHDSSIQHFVNGFNKQPAIILAFIGGNLLFLSWVPIGIGIIKSGMFPGWLGWVIAGSGISAWLKFLHVPVFQEYAGPVWPVSIILLGIYLIR
jgi:hypothetical protein